ncbi:hypothetical protein [Shewanella woodyi]|uniref:hypothetical protein n=1 Tax=Shewanella woodyi TaxID=60961 RepID=UPI003747832A
MIKTLQISLLIGLLSPLFSVLSEPIKTPNHQTNFYQVSFNTYQAYCFIKINGIDYLDNLGSLTGSIATGGPISSILSNGENRISIEVASLTAPQNLSFTPDASCKVSIQVYNAKGESFVTSLVATADEKLGPTGVHSPLYQGDKAMGPVTEQTVKMSVLHQLSRTFIATGLPQWTWTQATPFEESEQNIQKLKSKYQELQHLFANKNLDELAKAAYIAMDEQGSVQGYSAKEFWDSFDFKKEFANGASALPINWENQSLQSYLGGRLFRFTDNNGYSPLKLGFNDNESIISYNPYFSLVNGQIVISR